MANKKRNRLFLFGAIGAIAILAVVAALSKKGQKASTKVTVEAVTSRDIVETVAASGRIYPEVEVSISSDVSGEVVELYIEEGDSVTKGEVLARIRPDNYVSALDRAVASANSTKAQLANSRAQIEQMKAQVAQSRVQVENARTIHNRNTQLFNDGVISQADFDQSLTQLKSAEASLEAANANLKSAEQSAKAAEFSVASAEATVKEARDNLNRTTLYAPQSGVVSKLNVELGEQVVGNQMMSGSEILRIANMKYMEVQVDVSENDVLRVNIGDEVDVEVDAYLDRTFKGKVRQISTSAQESAAGSLGTDQVTNFTVKIRLDPNSYRDLVKEGQRFPFRPGMSASVEIKTNELKGIKSIPIQAVTTREEEEDKDTKIGEAEINEVVFKYQSDTVKMVKVEIGIQDDEFIQITKGLEVGDEVVVGPYSAVSRKLEDGDLVQKVEEDKLYDKKKKKKKDE